MEMKTKLFITGLALVALTTFASAQNSTSTQVPQGKATGKGVSYVDANNNGICDNYENRSSNPAAGKGTGNCRGYGQGNGKGQGMGRRQGQGCAKTGQGKGMNFVDADKNGVCDFRETPSKK
jgi:hypothetical protein